MDIKTINANGIIIQTGTGIPNHTATYGAIYYDTTTRYSYEYTVRWNLKTSIQSIIEIDMKADSGTLYTILPQTNNSIFIPTSLILVVTELTGTVASGLLTFSQGGGPGWAFSYYMNNQDSLKEVTYIFNESYGGRTAIDLQNIDWTVTLTQQSDATSQKITLITNGTIIPVVENIQPIFESGLIESRYIQDTSNSQDAPILSNCLYFDGTNSSVFTFEQMVSVSNLEINYSTDGVLWLVYNLGDTLIPNLYSIIGTEFILGNGFIGYISKVTMTILTLYDSYEVIFLNSSGDELQEIPIIE